MKRATLLSVLVLTACAAAQSSGPHVYLESASHGGNFNAARDQTIELTKDFQKEKECSEIAVTTRQDKADYTLTLNHIEHGFARDNQIRLANAEGDVLFTKEGGSIAKNVKWACSIIMSDHEKQSAPTTANK
jgi:hypothetical protein